MGYLFVLFYLMLFFGGLYNTDIVGRARVEIAWWIEGNEHTWVFLFVSLGVFVDVIYDLML